MEPSLVYTSILRTARPWASEGLKNFRRKWTTRPWKGRPHCGMARVNWIKFNVWPVAVCIYVHSHGWWTAHLALRPGWNRQCDETCPDHWGRSEPQHPTQWLWCPTSQANGSNEQRRRRILESYRYVLICRDPANKTWLYSGPSQHPKGLPLSSETYIHKIVADALCRFGCPLSTEASLLLSTDFTKSAPQCQITLLFVELNAIGWGASCTMDLIQMNCIDMTWNNGIATSGDWHTFYRLIHWGSVAPFYIYIPASDMYAPNCSYLALKQWLLRTSA